MPVYHFTFHAYRSWGPSHPRGYTKRADGYQPSDDNMARHYDGRAKYPRVWFDEAMQQVLVLGTIDVCARRGWRLHGVGTDPSHFHFVVSWREYLAWQYVRQKSKNVLSLLLGRLTGETGRPWFVRDGSRKRVKNRAHLDHLLDTYLPDHPGLFWREGDQVPEDVHHVL